MQPTRRADSRADWTAGNSSDTKIPMIASTTSSSTKVKPFVDGRFQSMRNLRTRKRAVLELQAGATAFAQTRKRCGRVRHKNSCRKTRHGTDLTQEDLVDKPTGPVDEYPIPGRSSDSRWKPNRRLLDSGKCVGTCRNNGKKIDDKAESTSPQTDLNDSHRTQRPGRLGIAPKFPVHATGRNTRHDTLDR